MERRFNESTRTSIELPQWKILNNFLFENRKKVDLSLGARRVDTFYSIMGYKNLKTIYI